MRPLQPTRTVDLAADRIRAGILRGEWAVGAHLPAERGLAEALGISRLTLRAALARLQAEGFVRARQGAGVEVRDYREAGVAVLPWLLAEGGPELVPAFLTLRRALAVEAVALACARATPAELDALQARADLLARTTDLAALMQGNLDFTEAVVRLADNLPISLLFHTVRQGLAARPDLSHALLADPDAVRASFGAVVALLRLGDPELARAQVRRALEALDTLTLARLEAR